MPKLYNEENMRALLGPYRIGTVDDLNEDGLLRIVRMRRRQLGQMTMALDTESAKRRWRWIRKALSGVYLTANIKSARKSMVSSPCSSIVRVKPVFSIPARLYARAHHSSMKRLVTLKMLG